jgi:hypothetical protein
MSLGDLTWFKAIATTAVIVVYGIACCLVIGFYFNRQAEREKEHRDPRDERSPVPAGE